MGHPDPKTSKRRGEGGEGDRALELGQAKPEGLGGGNTQHAPEPLAALAGHIKRSRSPSTREKEDSPKAELCCAIDEFLQARGTDECLRQPRHRAGLLGLAHP